MGGDGVGVKWVLIDGDTSVAGETASCVMDGSRREGGGMLLTREPALPRSLSARNFLLPPFQASPSLGNQTLIETHFKAVLDSFLSPSPFPTSMPTDSRASRNLSMVSLSMNFLITRFVSSPMSFDLRLTLSHSSQYTFHPSSH